METTIPSQSLIKQSTKVYRQDIISYTLMSSYIDAKQQYARTKHRLNRYCTTTGISYNEIRARVRKPSLWLEFLSKSKHFENVKASLLSHTVKLCAKGKESGITPPARKEEKHFPLSPPPVVKVVHFEQPLTQKTELVRLAHPLIRHIDEPMGIYAGCYERRIIIGLEDRISALDSSRMTMEKEISAVRLELAKAKAIIARQVITPKEKFSEGVRLLENFHNEGPKPTESNLDLENRGIAAMFAERTGSSRQTMVSLANNRSAQVAGIKSQLGLKAETKTVKPPPPTAPSGNNFQIGGKTFAITPQMSAIRDPRPGESLMSYLMSSDSDQKPGSPGMATTPSPAKPKKKKKGAKR